MFSAIYFEKNIQKHPKVLFIMEKYPNLPHISCHSYREIFNRKKQNFRQQKQKPALILAKKSSPFLFPIPKGYGIGHEHNWYFSHMLNCIFDCKYCYLQGQYSSAHYVLFVNFQDFQKEIEKTYKKLPSNERACFFSGYECDSLAFNSHSGFCESFLPFFQKHPQAFVELRTKSHAIQPLLSFSALSNIIIAYSLNPQPIIQDIENKTPSLKQRLKAMQKLQEKGWNVALRLDPLLLVKGCTELYSDFFHTLKENLDLEKVHSLTLGTVRFPKGVYKRIESMYPQESLFAPLVKSPCKQDVSYPFSVDKHLHALCFDFFKTLIKPSKIFLCQNPV